jgi:hypothetical protein
MPWVETTAPEGAVAQPPKVRLPNLSTTAGAAKDTSEPTPAGWTETTGQEDRAPEGWSEGTTEPLQPEHIKQLMQTDPTFRPTNDQIQSVSDYDQARPLGEKIKAGAGALWQSLKNTVVQPFQAVTKEIPESLANEDENTTGRVLSSINEGAVRGAVGLVRFGKQLVDVPYERWKNLQDFGYGLKHPLDYLGRVALPKMVRNAIYPESTKDVEERHAAALEAANPTGLLNQNPQYYSPDWMRGGEEPLPQTTEAISTGVQTLAPIPLPGLSLPGKTIAQQAGLAIPGKTIANSVIARAGQSAATLGEKAASIVGKGVEGAGKAAKATGEFPERAISYGAEKILGEEAAHKAQELADKLEGMGVGAEALGVHSLTGAIGATAKGLKVGGEVARGTGEAVQRLAESDSPLGRLAGLIKNPDNPTWMRTIANLAIRSGAAEAGALGMRGVKGAAHGAAFGAGVGLMDNQTPEELGANIGAGAAIGGVHGAANKRAAILEKNYQQAAQIYADNIRLGTSDSVLKKVPDDVFMNAVTFKKNMMPDVAIRFVDNSTAEANGVPKDVGGMWDEAQRTIWINPEARDAGRTSLHEMMHPVMESEVANRPDIKAQVDTALAQHGQTIEDFKKSYAEALNRKALEAQPDPIARQALVDDWLKQQQARSEAHPAAQGDENFWAYSEFMAEAAVEAMEGKNLAADVLTPSLARSFKEMFQNAGILPADEAPTKRLFASDFNQALKSPELRRLSRNLFQKQAQYMPGQTKPSEQAVKITPEMYGQHPAAVLHEQPNGEVGNDFVKVVNGKAVPIAKPEYQRKQAKRTQEFKAAFPRDVPPLAVGDTSTEAVVPRKMPAGQVQMSGTKLYNQVKDFKTLSSYQKQVIKHLDNVTQTGEPQTFWYHSIHKAGEGKEEAPPSRYPGDVEAQQVTGVGLGYHESKNHNVLWDAYSQTALDRKIQVWKDRSGPLSLELWHGDAAEFKKDLALWKKAREEGKPAKTEIGTDKANVINAMIIGGNRTFGEANPLRTLLRGSDRQGIVRSFRVDRIESIEPGGESMTGKPQYGRDLQNFSPGQASPAEETPVHGKLSEPREVRIIGPDGKSYRAVHDANQDFSVLGMGVVPQITAMEDIPGLTKEHSTTYGPSITKAGFRMEYTPTAKAQDIVDQAQTERTPQLQAHQFSPSEDPRAVKTAAIKTEDGEIHEGMMHVLAYDAYSLKHGGTEENPVYPPGNTVEGFTTNTPGEFLTRQEAFQRAQELKQVKAEKLREEELMEFGKLGSQSFSPKKRLEAISFEKAREFSPAEHAVGDKTIPLVHLSSDPELKTLDPKYFGKGKATTNDLRGAPKSYFFVKGSPMAADVNVFGQGGYHAYTSEVSGKDLYDLGKGKPDPLGYFSTPNREKADEAVKKAGYKGIYVETNDGRKVVMLYGKQPVNYAGQFKGSKAVVSKHQFSPAEAGPEPNEAVRKVAADYVPPTERPFAEQKATLYPFSPAEDKPFYSQLSRVVDDKFSGKEMPAAQLAAVLRNPQNGVKAEELKWSGLDDFLKGKSKVTKEEVQNHLAENQVQLKEVSANRYGNYVLPGGERYKEVLFQFNPKVSAPFVNPEQLTELPKGYKFRKEKDRPYLTGSPLWAVTTPTGNKTLIRGDSLAKAKEAMLNALNGQRHRTAWDSYKATAPGFTSRHWDAENILAHARSNNRTDTAGKPGLFLEEIQSDWHQKGRREGYKNSEALETSREEFSKEAEALKKEGYTEEGGYWYNPKGEAIARMKIHDPAQTDDPRLTKLTQLFEASKQQLPNSSAVADAPFKTTWHELVFRRMLQKAAEQGKEWLGWTTGEQQAARYDLSKQLSRVDVSPYGGSSTEPLYDVMAYDTKGERVLNNSGLTAGQLSDHIGKELAGKAIAEGAADKGVTYKGLDLKVGGEGMKGFYDKILVDYANKFGKKFGAKVEDKQLPASERIEIRNTGTNAEYPEHPWALLVDGKVSERFTSKEDAIKSSHIYEGATVHSLPITPEMRESVGKGVALFSPGESPTTIDPKKADRLGKRIFSAVNSKGGVTFNVATGKVQDTGYAVSLYPDRSKTTTRPVTPEAISQFIKDHYDLLADKRNSLGVWDDKDAGKIWLDVVMTHPDRDFSEYAGQKYNQKAIGDIAKYAKGQNGDIETGGTGEALENLAPAKQENQKSQVQKSRKNPINNPFYEKDRRRPGALQSPA